MTNVKPLIDKFESLLDESIQEVWAETDLLEHLSLLAQKPSLLFDLIEEVGEYCYDVLKQQSDQLESPELLSCYVVSFTWVNQVKSFFILWRDVLFQQQKAYILQEENKVTKTDLENLQLQSKDVVLAAAEDVKKYLENEIATIKKTKRGVAQKIAKWKLQQNPWPIYKEQLVLLTGQCKHLDQQFEHLKVMTTSFYFMKELVREEIDWCKKEISKIKESAYKTVSFINENIQDRSAKIAPYLEEEEGKIIIRNHLYNFTEIYEKQSESLMEKTEVAVFINVGILQYKEVNFKKSTRQWLESEIFPLFYEIWELTDNAIYGMKMSLVNIRNRVLLATGENNENTKSNLEKSDISQPLSAFLNKADVWENDIKDLELTINERLSNCFDISNVFDLNKEFLPVPLEYTINQFRIDRNELAEKVKSWLGRITGRVEQLKYAVSQEESYSVSERVVRYIQSRKGDENNNQYASIFLTKGYLGESFWVGREREIQHIKNVIAQWKLGYRGAVVLSGTRFCGKSLFGDLIANRFFADGTIRISPMMDLNVEGRTMRAGYDLGKALDFIRKHTLNKRPLVLIDDIELWAGDGISLNANVRQLKKHIDNYNSQIFYMVAMNNWVKAHLDQMFEVSKVFQTEINLDRMGLEEIRKAILIRHGATHKILVDSDGNELPPIVFSKIVSKIYDRENGNIGDILNQWAFSARRINEETVAYENIPNYFMPDFLNPDTAVLLAAIMMEKRTNEYRLRKMFGPSFPEKYGSILKRLLSIGLLTRQLDGWLELNEVAANETGRLLGNKGYLKFNQ